MKILFWNVHRNRNINRYIASIVGDNEIDILVMAEYNADESELSHYLETINKIWLNVLQKDVIGLVYGVII